MVRLVFLAAGADDGVNVKETIQYVTLSLFVYVFMSSRRCEARFRHYRAYTSFHMTSMARRFIGRPGNTFELVVLREQTHASGVRTANTRLKLSTELFSLLSSLQLSTNEFRNFCKAVDDFARLERGYTVDPPSPCSVYPECL